MRYWKVLSTLFLLLLSQVGLAGICINTSTNYKMFGSVIRAGSLLNGILFAFNDKGFHQYKVYHANSSFALAEGLRSMAADHCSLVLGLYTSHDCMVAGPLLKKYHLIAISPTCGASMEKQFVPYLYAAASSLKNCVKRMSQYVSKHSNQAPIFAIYQDSGVYSDNGFQIFEKMTERKIVPINVASDGQFDLSKFANLKNKKATLVFFTYPLPSVQILLQLSIHHILNPNMTVVGSPSWIYDTSVFESSIKKILLSLHSVVVPNILDDKSIASCEYKKKFNAKYHRNPLLIEYVTYDVAKLAVNCFRKSDLDGHYHAEKFRECLLAKPYSGVSGTFKFARGTPFANRKIYMTNFLR